jgi:hypothetical protein
MENKYFILFKSSFDNQIYPLCWEGTNHLVAFNSEQGAKDYMQKPYLKNLKYKIVGLDI